MAKSKGGFGKKWKKEQERLGVFTPLDKGDYSVVIKTSEIVANKNQDGRNWKIKYEVFEGKEKKKTINQWLAFDNPNDETEEIAAKHIASLCDAIGLKIEKLKNEKEVIGKKLIISLTVTTGDKKYGPGNEIKIYANISGNKKGKKKKKKKPF